MPNLASHIDCTGCGACAFRCPKSCIYMSENVIGVIYPQVDLSVCVDCRACEAACPILNPVEYYDIQICYAAWNNDQRERSTSASGGIAIAIYKEALMRGAVVIGASQNTDWTVTHKVARTFADIVPFKNSKYTFSHAYDVFPQVKLLLKEKKSVVMIGLPCQIAAMRRLFGDDDNLLLIDIVCHGSTPTKYLQQHIFSIEKSMGQKTTNMSFRAPEKGTENYFFTLYNNDGKLFYSKRSCDGDTYNIAFHRSISYRESCYHCHFARPERVSDITLGDYHGLGEIQSCEYGEEKVSTILIHTIKGCLMIDSIICSDTIHADERPIKESILGDAQLRRPSPKTQLRLDFENYICSSQGDFEFSMTKVERQIRKREYIKQCKTIPQKTIKKILRFLGILRNS